ncbi:MAG: hypothetical protein MJ108_09290 [Saccharofermentans sp.]|nr:hypothetical protein [Saccharofermentans sp.]
MKNNKLSIIAILIGAVAILVGAKMIIGMTDLSTHYVSTDRAYGCAFGADFYTEMYNVTKVVNDNTQKEVAEINGIYNAMVTIQREQTRNDGILICFIGAAFIFAGLIMDDGSKAPKLDENKPAEKV